LGVQSSRAFAVDQVELYNVWETQVTNYSSYSNSFDFRVIELQAIFTSPSGRRVNFFGFYDGDGSGGQAGNIWKLRFMPDESGAWAYTYTWSDGAPGGSAGFSEKQSSNKKNHGHVLVDTNNPKYLIHDDGTFHYWWGANWINAKAYGPQNIEGIINKKYVTDETFITLLDTLEKYQHNGLLIKISLFPLKDDKYTWNLQWIHRFEWLVREMQARGIYAQINFFDTWSREKNSLNTNTDGKQQVFNVWEPGDEGAKKNYIKTIVSRFVSFSNVYWELGNEMEHSPNSGKDFVKQANSKYIPWIRQHDPYNLPIGLSEGCWRTADVDIGFLHQPKALFTSTENKPVNTVKQYLKKIFNLISSKKAWDRPVIMNELVRGGISGPLWKDSTIRHDNNRVIYRKTFWLMFTLGGSGSSEATWLNFNTPPNQSVMNVMNDQMYLRNFIESLPVNINDMTPDDFFVVSGPSSYKTRCKKGIIYVSYFHLPPNETMQKGTVKVNLPEGNYSIKWFNPKHGTYTPKKMVRSKRGTVSIEHPEFFEDIVLLVRKNSNS
ncbi:MAG: DUF5060 domain-containing protein, partial [Bacteroidales bacterium]|nr:DUF5060 domain-containing protein [Bacteroidales bacterium]